ncbi:MAG: nuclear transport factor 2 family protein [Burkholderiales bacterium]|nr:nuclear transport factor 2 family protein [Burkholderiales bacterium]
MSLTRRPPPLASLLLMLAMTATPAFAAPAGAAAAGQPATSPRQAWASRDGRVELQPLRGAVDPTRLGDRLMIQETFARFGIAYDEVRTDVLATLFTDDALLEVADGRGQPFETSVGATAIARHLGAALAQQGDQRRHLIGNVVIDQLGATQAKALAYGVVTVAADGLILGASVVYAAELHRGSDGAWRFARLFIGIDHYAGRKPSVKD